MCTMKIGFPQIILCFILSVPGLVQADGNSIDKVYHPYVMPLETEVEWRAIFQNDDENALDDQQKHRFGMGYSFIDSWFTELYLIGKKSPDDQFKIEAIELEVKWQITEQGEYAFDWGLLIELEKELDDQIWEFSTGLLIEKEWGRWVGAFNFFVEAEWGDDIKDEIETTASAQIRYRFNRLFEPAIEFYQSEETTGIGPVGMGDIRLGIGKKIHWELGVIFGLKDETPNQTLKALVEYEF
jgi:hypothetical protein